jgi:hypothetical protein
MAMTDGGDPGVHDDELATLRALRHAAPGEPVRWEHPPADMWSRIEAQTTAAMPPSTSPREVVALPQRSRTTPQRRWWIAAAAAVLIAVTAGVLVISGRSSGPDVLASTTLERLGASGAGRAELVKDHGNLQLRVSTSGLQAGPGFFEVWVIDPSITKLVSLGPLRSDGTYDLPPGLDPAEFPIVDISLEPIDGVATHSGNSLLRGQLRF